MPSFDKKKATAAVEAEVKRMIHEAETAPLPDIEYEYGVEGEDEGGPAVLPHMICDTWEMANVFYQECLELQKQYDELPDDLIFRIVRRPKPEPWERVEDEA